MVHCVELLQFANKLARSEGVKEEFKNDSVCEAVCLCDKHGNRSIAS